MKKLLLVFSFMITFFVIISGVLNAQPNYNFSSSQGAYISIVGQPGTLPFNWRVTSSPNNEDFTFPLTIVGPTGFMNPFPYDGVPFKEIQVSCNGFLKFCNSLTGDTLSTSKTTGATNRLMAFTRNVLAPLWDDNAVFNEAVDIVYQFAGPPGLRVLTIEWNNVKWQWNSGVVNAGFQIRLYENNGWIEYHYGNFPNAPVNSGTGFGASVGMNDGTPISSTTSGVEATGTFLSINFGGTPAARTFHRSYGYEYFSITAGPDPVGPLPLNTTIFTFIPQVPVPMIGAYQVGGPVGPPRFARLSDAAEALNLNGVGGPVILNLWPGPEFDPGIPAPVWDDIFHLIAVNGTSAINTITVQVDPNYGGQVTIAPRNGTAATNSPGATAGDAMIRLDGTRYTTITGMHGRINLINNTQNITTTTQCEMGIFLGNSIVTTFYNPSVIIGAQWNLFKLLYIDMNNSLLANNNGGAIGIRFGTNGVNADPIQGTNSNNEINDCEIVDFYRSAVYMYGFSSAVPDFGNKITGTFEQTSSKFHDANLTFNIQDCRAIEAYDQKNLLIENTDIYNIISTALVTNGVWGIRINPSAGDGTSGTCIIRNCQVYNIENQGVQVTTGFACGIEVTSPYHEGTVVIYNNKVYDIFTNGSTTGRAIGMQFLLGGAINITTVGNTALNVYNNYIYDLRAPRSTGNPSIRGLDIQSLGNVLTAQVYYNTVYLDSWTSPPQLAGQYSTCLYLANLPTSSVDLRNNILVTDCSAGAAQPPTGIATCIYASTSTDLRRLALTTNNNYLFANGPAPWRLIAYEYNSPPAIPSVIYPTLATYQAAIATGGLGGPRDAQAVTIVGAFPPFISGAPPYNLRLIPLAASEVESGALPIIGYGNDFYGNARNPNFPDIGAEEYNGALVADIIAPQILYTPLPNQNTLIPPALIATITDRSGIPPGLPTLWIKRTIDLVWTAVPGIPGPGPNDYTFPFNYGFPAPPVSVGDVVQYYIGAMDAAGNIGTNPTGGAGGPPPGLIPPAVPNTYKIIAPPYGGGTYNVGLAKFNEVTSKNLYPQTFTKMVKERVRVERNLEVQNIAKEQSSELIDLSLIKEGIDRAYDFDETKFSPTEFVMKDVVKEYVLLMENGQIYSGPQYVSVEELKQQGKNTDDMEKLIGFWSTLKGAADSLNLHGISGAVTLQLTDAAYNGETYPIDFNSIAGVSAANTITIKPKAGVTPVFSNAAAQIKITNTSYFTIDGSNTVGGTTKDLTINRSATAGQAIWIGSLGTTPVSDVTIKNCIVATGETVSSTPIMVSDGTTAGSSGYFSKITIQNDSIFKGRFGIYINGGIIPRYGTNITIQDNSLYTSGANQLKLYGIYIQGGNGVSIKNNNVGNFESGTAENDRGIWVAAGTINATIEKNRVHDIGTTISGNGGNGIVVSSSSVSCNNIIKNNFVYKITGTGSSTVNANPLAIYIFGAQTGLGVYNNSIYLTGASLNTAAAFSCGVCISDGTYSDVQNNVIYNALGQVSSSIGAMGVFAFKTLAQFTNLSNNVYYIVPTAGPRSFGHVNVLGYLGFNQPLATWKANSGKDANSQSGNPKYVNAGAGDLHILTTTGTPCESAGIPIVGVVDDIEIPGDARNPLTPDVGADEFAGTQYMTLNLTAMIEGICDGTNIISDTIEVKLRNTSSPFAIIDSANNVILNINGNASVNFRDPVISTSYYIELKHRNALRTISKSGGESWSTFNLNYDFTTAASQAYNSNQTLIGTKYCLYSGDVSDGFTAGSQDGYIDIFDDFEIYNDSYAGSYRLLTDLNLDTFVDIFDDFIVYNNSYLGVSGQYPTGYPRSERVKKETKKLELRRSGE